GTKTLALIQHRDFRLVDLVDHAPYLVPGRGQDIRRAALAVGRKSGKGQPVVSGGSHGNGSRGRAARADLRPVEVGTVCEIQQTLLPGRREPAAVLPRPSSSK